MLLFTQPINATYGNKGVDLDVNNHSKRVLSEYRANWLKFLVAMKAFKVVIFDGAPLDGGAEQGVAIARIDNLKVLTTSDHAWKDGPFKTNRHRHISYNMTGTLVVEAYGGIHGERTQPLNSPIDAPPGGTTGW